MKNLLLVLVASFLLGACGKSGSGSGPSPANVGVLDLTDRAECAGVTPPGLTLGSASWMLIQKAPNGIGYRRIYRFHPRSMEVIVTARSDAHMEHLRVRSRVRYQPGGIAIMSRAHRAKLIHSAQGPVPFEFSLMPTVATYSFVGSCLQLNLGGESMVLVPNR